MTGMDPKPETPISTMICPIWEGDFAVKCLSV